MSGKRRYVACEARTRYCTLRTSSFQGARMLTVCLGLRCREFAIPIHGSTQSKLALTNGDTVRCYPVPTPRLCRSTAPITHLWYCEGRGQEDGLAWPQACWD